MCKAGRWIASLDAEDKEALSVFLTAGYSMAQLHELFTAEAGMRIGLTTWKDHLRGRCSCE